MKRPAFRLPSPETGTEYFIYIETPKLSGPWVPVVFLDGDDMFAAAATAYHSLPADKVSPLLLIGVGYGGSFGNPVNRRGRDYTPDQHSHEASSGGADSFLQFLTVTLWPELAKRYPLDPIFRGVAGHSLGSLFVLHALFQSQSFFTHHLASAPALWWADRAMLRRIADLRERQSVLPGRLFLCVGEDDSESMTGDLTRLETQLATKPFEQLEIVSRHFARKNHFNVLATAFETGLRELFGTG